MREQLKENREKEERERVKNIERQKREEIKRIDKEKKLIEKQKAKEEKERLKEKEKEEKLRLKEEKRKEKELAKLKTKSKPKTLVTNQTKMANNKCSLSATQNLNSKKGRGRPKGSKNKTNHSQEEVKGNTSSCNNLEKETKPKTLFKSTPPINNEPTTEKNKEIVKKQSESKSILKYFCKK